MQQIKTLNEASSTGHGPRLRDFNVLLQPSTSTDSKAFNAINEGAEWSIVRVTDTKWSLTDI